MRPIFLAAPLTALLAAPVAAAPAVVTDFAPAQSITQSVMAGIGEPTRILPPGAEPHSYSLRPSEARALDAADLVVWIGPGMTPWLADPIATLATHAKVLTLDTLPGLTLLPIRATGPFEPHVHDEDDGHDEQGGHDGHDEQGGYDEDHADTAHAMPATGVIDQHLWLDPANAAIFAQAIADALAELDPANAARYHANATAFDARLDALTAEISAELAPVRGKPYFVFHDAYQYFEHRFDVPAAGSVALHDAEAPGAARVAEIRGRIAGEKVVCAFSEPQFPPKLLATLTEGTNARTGALDPEGTSLPDGPDLYPTMIRDLATGLVTCLAP